MNKLISKLIARNTNLKFKFKKLQWVIFFFGIYSNRIVQEKRIHPQKNRENKTVKTGVQLYDSIKITPWAPIWAKTLVVSFSVRRVWEINQNIWRPKCWILFLIIFLNFHGAIWGSLNLATRIEKKKTNERQLL